MNAAQIRVAAPLAPSCFTEESWVYYLLSAQQNSKSSNTPFKHGVFRPEFSHCNDCTLAHSSAMSRAGRCNPAQFRLIALKNEATHECSL
jgi:hypothetical protein